MKTDPLLSSAVDLASPRASARRASLAGVALVALLAACGGIESDIREAIGKDIGARNNCLDLRFPTTVQIGPGLFGTPSYRLQELKALDQAGVIRKVNEQPRIVAGGIRVSEVRLDLTDAGRKSMRDGRPCYGRTEVVRVIDYTNGKAPDGAQAVTARVLLKHHVEADWARDPVFANQVASGEAKAEYALVKTNKGWRVAF